MASNLISRAMLLSLFVAAISEPGSAQVIQSNAQSVHSDDHGYVSPNAIEEGVQPLRELRLAQTASSERSPKFIYTDNKFSHSSELEPKMPHEVAASSAESAVEAAPNRGRMSLEFKYVGNNFSSKFHRPSCKFARCIWGTHLVTFAQRHDATDIGYVPCRWCLPPSWKTVKAVLLGGPMRNRGHPGGAPLHPTGEEQALP